MSVLGGDRDSLAAEFLEGEEVEGGRGDDDLGRLDVDVGVVELVDQLGQGGEVAVHCARGASARASVRQVSWLSLRKGFPLVPKSSEDSLLKFPPTKRVRGILRSV